MQGGLGSASALQGIVVLQAFDGTWGLSEAFGRALGCTLAALHPRTLHDATAWATALALAYLRLKLGSHADEWEFVAAKADKWLCAALGDGRGALVEEASRHLCQALARNDPLPA